MKRSFGPPAALEGDGACLPPAASTTEAGGMCILVGLNRGIDIHLTTPIDANPVTVTTR